MARRALIAASPANSTLKQFSHVLSSGLSVETLLSPDDKSYKTKVSMDFPTDADSSGYAGSIWKTTDGGRTYAEVVYRPGICFDHIDCTDANTCWVTQCGPRVGCKIEVTRDGGRTWQVQLELTQANPALTAIKMFNSQEGWASGSVNLDPFNFVANLFHTTNGGVSWSTAVNLRNGLPWALSLAPSRRAANGYEGHMTTFDPNGGPSNTWVYR
jgi:photosystem II stability/assembly factor-like uncharacterized protein